MIERAEKAVAARIRKLASEHHVVYVRAPHDRLAHNITRLAGDDVLLDEIEQLLIALQRSGHLSRIEMVKLQAAYLGSSELRHVSRVGADRQALEKCQAAPYCSDRQGK